MLDLSGVWTFDAGHWSVSSVRMTDSDTAGSRSVLWREKTVCHPTPTFSALHGKERLVVLGFHQAGRREGAPLAKREN